ncbi:antitoxin VapB [Cricetibacter osteomyelitidis]|uniref:Antitoxin VapB n=1 Tax=Cricetibacter osteomyelitidis TaxID=1521931 RepID=A0A4R2T3T4_9PAST|nr:type II toxin-antitoxin system VapB family antitoxin [Cricetibacter osteomyelitidis]TCP96950.1 antitoxin VapB [Cricetibacter osteomyelitidis]
MQKASIFKNNRNQAIRLPQSAAFPEHIKQVEVVCIGNTRILTPIGERWQTWAKMPSQLTDDCFMEREQPVEQEREGF